MAEHDEHGREATDPQPVGQWRKNMVKRKNGETHLEVLQAAASASALQHGKALRVVDVAYEAYRTAHNAVLAYEAELARLENARKRQLSKREQEVIERLAG